MMANSYSVKKDGKKKLSANFCVKEFACNDGSDKVLIDLKLVDLLQQIRDKFGKAVVISSAYRTASYNTKIGGVSNSQHTKGTASDISIVGVEPLEIAKYVEYLHPNDCGIGVYNNAKNGKFVHLDVRANRSRWTNYGTEKSVNGFYGYAEPKKEMTTADAISMLNKSGIISEPNKWYDGTWSESDLKCLLIKMAKHIKGEM